MSLIARVVGLVLLSGLFVGAGVDVAQTQPAYDPYPSSSSLAAEYDAYLGEEVLLFGTVTDSDDATGTIQISIGTGSDSLDLVVRDTSVTVGDGGTVQVYGILRPGNEVEPINVAVVNAAGSSKLYKYAVSAVGALVLVGLFFRYWTVDARSMAFVERDRDG